MNEEDIRKLLRTERELGHVAGILRTADMNFQSVDMRHKVFLNIAGKILEDVEYYLRVYRYADEEKQIELVKKLKRILSYIDNKNKEVSE